MSLTFAVSAVAVIGAVGAAVDFSTLSSADARAQAIADQTALSAAVFVKQNGREPNPPVPVGDDEELPPEEGFLDKSFRTYTAHDLGYDFKGFVKGGADNVNVEVTYDDQRKEARVSVSGDTVPTFMQIFGSQNLGFSAEATVKYEDYDLYDPATVVMVLDNSGSMAFDDQPVVIRNGGVFRDQFGNRYGSPDTARPRIDALKDHASNFMQELESLVGDQSDDDDKVLRTGLLAYNHDTINNRTVNVEWQTSDTQDSIDDMVAIGGTNSAPPVDLARIWLEREDNIHKNVHGDEPLKFMVFMTDGLNTDESVTWVEEEGTGQWRGLVRRCFNWRCSTNYEEVESVERPSYGSDWTEGKYDSTANVQTLADCTSMKNDGVKIYTIGFALAEGFYDTNGYFGNTQVSHTDSDVRNQAYSFLSGCASEPSTFLTAETAEQLEQAFTRIGNDIQTEIIRLSN